MNRRSFFGALAKGIASFTILTLEELFYGSNRVVRI